MNKAEIKVVLKRAKLTDYLFIEEFAQLDYGSSLNEDGSLPKDRYCVYYRVGLDSRNYGVQYLEDRTCSSLSNLDALIKFFVTD